MINRFLMFFVNLMQKYLPDPFTIAWIITLVVCVLALVFTPAGPLDLADYWGKNFFGILPFAMQMVLLLISGYALAAAPQVRKLLASIAGLAKTPRQVILLVAFTSMVLFFLNWGLGLIAAAFLAREAARLNPEVDMRAIVAAGFSGIIITHGGLSASVPLLINTPGHFLEKQIGLIPLEFTIFHPQALAVTVTLAVVIPFVCVLMLPKPEQTIKVDPALLVDATPPKVEAEAKQIADRLDRSLLLNVILVLMGAVYIVRTFYNNGFNLNLNLLIFIFIILGLALHGSLIRYSKAVGQGASTCSGIILQFPFYAGIMGIMSGSGLVNLISQMLLSFASADSYETICYLSSLIISVFVPSAGGHWVVQAPFMLPPAVDLGVPFWKVAMGVAWGESIWNVVCPFWALPLLAIAKISLRDLIGFTVILFIVGNVVVLSILHIIPN
jgi:short-chain fatty acids transporter